MKALVTGGAGFIGSHLVDALVDRGDPVVVVDDLSTGRRENLDDALVKGAELVETDITDAAAIADVFQTRRPEVVFHLAAQIDVRRSVSDPVFDLGVNVGGTLNLLEAARQAGTRRFVLASTGGAIYGEGSGRQLPLDEQAECRPDAHYGQSKYAAEGYVSLYGRLYDALGRSPCGSAMSTGRGRTRSERRAWWRSSAERFWAEAPRGCSATATRRATTCTSATSSRRSWPAAGRRPGAPTTSAPASRRACSSSAACWRASASESSIPRWHRRGPARSSESRSTAPAPRASWAGGPAPGSQDGLRATAASFR